jgi:hypothetical protein
MTAQDASLDLGVYRRFVVAFSGGKDRLAALLHLLSLGVPPHAIELHHHDVDGEGPTFMGWPCTPGYVRAIAEHLGIALYVSWRERRPRQRRAADPMLATHIGGLHPTFLLAPHDPGPERAWVWRRD